MSKHGLDVDVVALGNKYIVKNPINKMLEKWPNNVIVNVLLHYWQTIFLFDSIKLLWHNQYCIKRYK